MIIEDFKKDYLLEKSLLPSSCVTAYDVTQGVKGGLSVEERKFITMLKDKTDDTNDDARFNKSCIKSRECIFEFIKKNKEDLRLIICDYLLNGCNNAGYIFIEKLREADDWFMKNIPVVVFTGLTDRTPERDALELKCFVIQKSDVKGGKDKNCSSLVNRFFNEKVGAFDKLYRQHINDKRYKVAFSFTGSDYKGTYIEPHREFVRDVARIVMRQYGDKVFYDEYCIVSGWNPEDFKNVYENQCNFIVVFLSDNYGTPDNKWTEMEWEGIKTHFNEDGVCGKKNVLFVPIGDKVNYENILERLNVSPNHIWYKDGIKAREKYYSILKGESADIKEKLMQCFYGKSNFEAVLECFMNEYNEFQKNGELKGVASWIINHIKNHDKSE
ncbi:MAG: hypothetical protein MJ001_06495 [Paludibacteraceae bacterium]|nr:hypothetical protein [Paludibacteraceae bacterium]